MENAALQEKSDESRLQTYKILTSACTHLYSKGKLQEDKFVQVAGLLADIATSDPIFMAHLTAYCAQQDSKDLKVLTVFFNSLNDANGMPFFKGSDLNKPNFRTVSYAILQNLDPHLALRVLQLAHKKFGVKNILNDSSHFPTGLKTAFKKYIRYREQNPDALRGMKNAGLSGKMQQLYRLSHVAPSDEAASILNWKQKDGREIESLNLPDFASMKSSEIAEFLQNNKLSPTIALSVIPNAKVTAAVAKELLNNCTGNQSIILYNWFARNGFLDVKSIKELFDKKAKTATTAVDRIETLTKNADESDKKVMAEVRSTKRKQEFKKAALGKIYLHIDASSSMNTAIQYAKDNAATIAECIDDPQNNFGWGLFNASAAPLRIPSNFTKEGFHQALYGARASGCTDCIALYDKSREMGADVDIYITDQGHNVGSIATRIEKYHATHNYPKPRAAVIIDFSGNRNAMHRSALEDGLTKAGIPVSIMKPESLKESALIAQSVATAIKGELAVIESIMETPLPTLPKWWNSVDRKVSRSRGNIVETENATKVEENV